MLKTLTTASPPVSRKVSLELLAAGRCKTPSVTRDLSYILGAPMEHIRTKTSCNTPCRYKEYVVLEGPLESNDPTHFYFSVDLWLASTDTTVLTKIPVYPWTSLLAEFGGTFSLFFGLSMMTLWDGLEKLSNVVKYCKRGTIDPEISGVAVNT